MLTFPYAVRANDVVIGPDFVPVNVGSAVGTDFPFDAMGDSPGSGLLMDMDAMEKVPENGPRQRASE